MFLFKTAAQNTPGAIRHTMANFRNKVRTMCHQNTLVICHSVLTICLPLMLSFGLLSKIKKLTILRIFIARW